MTLTFKAPGKADSRSYYVYSAAPDDAVTCRAGTTFGPVARDVRTGETVTVTTFIPARCRGVVRGSVTFHQPGKKPDPAPFGDSSPHDPIVGRYRVAIPRGG